jgi:hypothetical protein
MFCMHVTYGEDFTGRASQTGHQGYGGVEVYDVYKEPSNGRSKTTGRHHTIYIPESYYVPKWCTAHLVHSTGLNKLTRKDRILDIHWMGPFLRTFHGRAT